jgi:hypothetical protein
MGGKNPVPPLETGSGGGAIKESVENGCSLYWAMADLSIEPALRIAAGGNGALMVN